MNMNKTFFLKTDERTKKWRLIDAQDKVLGRLATEIADILRGKDLPQFTNHTDGGDYVVVVNAEKVKLTGNKLKGMVYTSYSGWIGGKKEKTVEEVLAKDPTYVIHHAVKGMLPKNKLSRQLERHLKVYAGPEHPHKAQIK